MSSKHRASKIKPKKKKN